MRRRWESRGEGKCRVDVKSFVILRSGVIRKSEDVSGELGNYGSDGTNTRL